MIWAGSLGSFLAGGCTALGALPIFLRRRWSASAQRVMLALAGGVMLGATIFSLLVPALEIAERRLQSALGGALLASAGLALGALGIWLVHSAVPHEHFMKGQEGSARLALGRNWLFVLAITLHNFPEGMSVGASYGSGLGAGVAMAIGIGLQNLPEGLAVAAALVAAGSSRARAFAVAALTGLVEPLGGVLGVALVSWSDVLLPWGLSIAAGAMLFVISGEVIPETHREGSEGRATFGVIAGFIVMLVLDVSLA